MCKISSRVPRSRTRARDGLEHGEKAAKCIAEMLPPLAAGVARDELKHRWSAAQKLRLSIFD
jgi:hypothetical protein